ncbi:MAG: hypothetical protein IPP61_04395 [Cytophagaceae bacterium]|nr:hypothetical protein [Cytophagaceae bacterium]MBL0301587.1 hypothetical protein [Cytophagaceae bacterium]MBL0324411.1 hypothetical protein [Cytophagaceae bacterium]
MSRILLLFLFLSLRLSAQVIPPAEPIEEPEEDEKEPQVLFEKPKPAWRQNLHYGGNIWLGFWGAFYIDASPMAGYDVTGKGTVVGLGASFIYQGAYKQSGNLAYGGRLFARQAVWRNFFAQGEFEMMNAPNNVNYFYNWKDDGTERKWGGSPLLGIGMYQNRTRSQNGSFISIMYNLGSPSFGFVSPQSLGGNGSPFVIRIGYFF